MPSFTAGSASRLARLSRFLKPGKSAFAAWPSHTPTAKNTCGFSARHGHKKQPEIADQCADALAYCGFRFAPGETFQVLKTWKVCARPLAKPYRQQLILNPPIPRCFPPNVVIVGFDKLLLAAKPIQHFCAPQFARAIGQN